MDRRAFTKLMGLLALPSSKSFGEIIGNPKIVVIGAGIIGTMIAYELIKKGARVILIDKEIPASGASGNSFSWINATYPKKPFSYNFLSQMGIEAYKNLEREFQFDIKWSGSLEWFEELGQQEKLFAEIKAVKKYPRYTPVSLISSVEAEFMEPKVFFGDENTIVHSESDGAIDTIQAIQMIHNEFERLGGESIFSCEFLKLNEKNGRLNSIDTTMGKFEVDHAVFACGIDTDKNLSIDTSSTPTPGIILKSIDFKMIPGVGVDEVSILRFLSVSIPHAKTA